MARVTLCDICGGKAKEDNNKTYLTHGVRAEVYTDYTPSDLCDACLKAINESFAITVGRLSNGNKQTGNR
jgi:hypothetical protein